MFDRVLNPTVLTAAELVKCSYVIFTSYNKQPRVYLHDCVREGRLSVNSKYPISKLSPASQMTRLSKSNEQRKHYATKLKKLGKLDCEVSDKQREELVQLVSAANKSEYVKERLVKGDHTLGEDNNCHKQTWQQDLTERLEYEGINLVQVSA